VLRAAATGSLTLLVAVLLTVAAPAYVVSAPAQPTAERKVTHGTTYRAAGEVTPPPRLRATAWAVVDMTSGQLLGKHRARARLPQASTIKLLTAITAVNRLRARTPVRASALAAQTICSCAGVRAGRLYTRQTLISGMLVKSGNDAAEAIAGGDRRGRQGFLTAMNRTAARLGASDTVAMNPSGLDQWGAHSSARDLLILLRAASQRRPIAPWLDQPSVRFGPVDGRMHRLDATTDYILDHEDAYAGKNGYTTRAGNTLVVATRILDHDIAVALLGSEAGYTTAGARALTEWAAENAAALRPVGRLP
jgi:serine-type D-Ala-D-Ala carboxypeptidase (penicillin-binding protein 5/6)